MDNHTAKSEKTEVVRTFNPDGRYPLLLICEHASNHIPARFQDLGLAPEARASHVAWDPGALETAMNLSKVLDAPLVHGLISRLVYDCNRPPEATDAMPDRSEIFNIPGNRNLPPEEKTMRIETYYRPFEHRVEETLNASPNLKALVTIHSFTPVYHGEPRAVEIGILHDIDTRLADSVLEIANGYQIRRNEPYGPADGVTHTLKRHGLSRGLLNVMIEIRNDLIQTPDQCREMAGHLGNWLNAALSNLADRPIEEAAK